MRFFTNYIFIVYLFNVFLHLSSKISSTYKPQQGPTCKSLNKILHLSSKISSTCKTREARSARVQPFGSVELTALGPMGSSPAGGHLAWMQSKTHWPPALGAELAWHRACGSMGPIWQWGERWRKRIKKKKTRQTKLVLDPWGFWRDWGQKIRERGYIKTKNRCRRMWRLLRCCCFTLTVYTSTMPDMAFRPVSA